MLKGSSLDRFDVEKLKYTACEMYHIMKGNMFSDVIMAGAENHVTVYSM